jgi:t-SNARE complex subunit (syntaxin)
MQAQLIDKKLAILYDKYRDRHFAANAQKEVEDIRRTALKVGAATTAGAFILNEVSRLSMRSRKSHIIIFSVCLIVCIIILRKESII